MRLLNVLFLLAFLASAALQLNDPDPARWVALYLLAAGLSLAWERRLGGRISPLALALPVLAWAGWIASALTLDVPVAAALGEWQMRAHGAEELRELGGLGLVGGWMLVLALCGPRTA